MDATRSSRLRLLVDSSRGMAASNACRLPACKKILKCVTAVPCRILGDNEEACAHKVDKLQYRGRHLLNRMYTSCRMRGLKQCPSRKKCNFPSRLSVSVCAHTIPMLFELFDGGCLKANRHLKLISSIMFS